MMPLSQVLSYNTGHLIDAAAHWQGLADQREEVFAGVQNTALTLPWEGAAADALHERTQGDYRTAMNSADNLRQAASIAQNGASTLDQMHSRVLYTLQDAQADGFTATEDLSVVDTRPSANGGELAQRQAQAQAYAGQLKAQVTDLVTHDTQVGADMTNATAGEGKIQFTDYKQDGGDNTIKVDPTPNPPAVINAHVGENPPPDPGKHQCSAWDITKYTGEGVGGPLLTVGSVLGGIAASPLGPGEWAMAIGGVLTGGATTIDGFEGLAGCE
jgi:hypothetical protein